jgi:hypothetical protein
VKYVLVDKGDNIVSTIDLASNVGVSGAKTYFTGVKQIDPKEFDKLWKVMTRDEYDRKLEMGLRKPSSHGQIEWWKEDKEIIDDELKF